MLGESTSSRGTGFVVIAKRKKQGKGIEKQRKTHLQNGSFLEIKIIGLILRYGRIAISLQSLGWGWVYDVISPWPLHQHWHVRLSSDIILSMILHERKGPTARVGRDLQDSRAAPAT